MDQEHLPQINPSAQNGISNGAFEPQPNVIHLSGDDNNSGVAVETPHRSIVHLTGEPDSGVDATIPNGDTTRGDERGLSNIFSRMSHFISPLSGKLREAWSRHWKWILLVVFLVFWHAYLLAAMIINVSRSVPLIIFTILFWTLFLYSKLFKPFWKAHLSTSCCTPLTVRIRDAWNRKIVQIGVYVALVAALVIFLLVDTRDNQWRLLPITGLIAFVLLGWLCSSNPKEIKWRPVIWGLALQFLFGLMVLRWETGKNALQWLSKQIVQFLSYVDEGSNFVYGFTANPPSNMTDDYGVHKIFVFSVLPVIFFFSSVVAVLYYFGVIQVVIAKIGWLMQISMGTTAAESLCCASNIFFGMTEAPFLIRPYIARLTKSEVHAVMTGGFATIAGGIFASYVLFGACPSHLIAASVMSAPAALAMSKLMCPETEESQTRFVEDLELGASEESNVVEAVSNGATQAVFVVLNIAANIIVFIAFLEFFNHSLTWLGHMVDIEQLTFQKIVSYLFFPLAFLMGASNLPNTAERNAEVLQVSELMGIKTFINEFIAYKKLGKLKFCCMLSPRAELVATYALCGFSNPGSIGICIAGLASLCPDRRAIFAKVAVRAFVAGTMACFMTACIAGILYDGSVGCPVASAFLDQYKSTNCAAEFNVTATHCESQQQLMQSLHKQS